MYYNFIKPFFAKTKTGLHLTMKDKLILSKKFNDILSNGDNPFNHLKFVKGISKGRQGVTGVVSAMDKNGRKSKDFAIYKYSIYNDYTITNEKLVMNSLQTLCRFCHNFPLLFGSCTTNVRPTCLIHENPFKVYEQSEYVEREVLFAEYIKGISLKDHIFSRNNHTSVPIVMSLIKQTLLSVMTAFLSTGLTHYDLHSMNILTPKCANNLLVLYALGNEEYFLVPTYGYYPVIIDYGFSYSDSMEDRPMWSYLFHTESGYTTNMKNEFADFRMFLVSIMDDLGKSKYTKRHPTVKDAKTVITNIFNKKHVDWNTGWIKPDKEQKSVAEYVCNHLERIDRRSRVFTKHMYEAFNILQTLVVLPLESSDADNQQVHNERAVYKSFITEWLKFEKIVMRLENSLSILKIIIETAIKVRPAYIAAYDNDEHDACTMIAKDFASFVTTRVESVIDFCVLDDVNFANLLESCIDIGEVIERLVCQYQPKHCSSPEEQKKYTLGKILVNPVLDSPAKIFTAIDVNAETPVSITSGTPVMIIDCLKKKRSLYKITQEDSANLNKIHRLLHGQYIYNCHDIQTRAD